MVHAHTQAQIAAGIYKGDAPKEGTTTTTAVAANTVAAVATAKASAPVPAVPSSIAWTPEQKQQHASLKEKQEREKAALRPDQAAELAQLEAQHKQQLDELLASFQSQQTNPPMSTTEDGEPAPSATSPQFIARLQGTLSSFWTEQLHLIQQLPLSQTEQDFKTHNDLPLARIKRIMKSDEDVRMISAEAPVLFAKACELFILELTLRSWSFSQHHKRRTLQKEDIKEAIQRTDIFDFLVDVIQ